LGEDSIRSGVKATVIGVIAVSGFMLVYYSSPGCGERRAHAHVLILIGRDVLVRQHADLAGYRGHRADDRQWRWTRTCSSSSAFARNWPGKSMRGALAAGYDKAFGTIFDSNLTTLISSVILIFMRHRPVKGFGVTLTIRRLRPACSPPWW